MPALEVLFRWIHVLAGVIWIGHLYFFNFVNIPFQGKLDGATKKAVNPELLPRALFWFRWGAAWTWATGVLLLLLVYYHQRYAVEAEGFSAGSWVMLAVTFVAPFVYDALYRSPLGQNVRGAFVVAYALVAVAVYLYSHFAGFSYRGDAHPHRVHVRDDHGLERLVPDLARPAEDHPRGEGRDRPRRRPREAGRPEVAPQHLHVGAPPLHHGRPAHDVLRRRELGHRPEDLVDRVPRPSSAWAGTSSSSSTRGARRSRGSDPGPGRSTMAKPEPEPDPRLAARNQRLNVLFAVSALGLLVTTGLMVKADYDREWRQHQVAFNRLRVALTKEQIEKALEPGGRPAAARGRGRRSRGGGRRRRRNATRSGRSRARSTRCRRSGTRQTRTTASRRPGSTWPATSSTRRSPRGAGRRRPAGRSSGSSSAQWEKERLAVEDIVARREAGKARLAELQSARRSRRRRRAPRSSPRRRGSRTCSGASSPAS